MEEEAYQEEGTPLQVTRRESPPPTTTLGRRHRRRRVEKGGGAGAQGVSGEVNLQVAPGELEEDTSMTSGPLPPHPNPAPRTTRGPPG